LYSFNLEPIPKRTVFHVLRRIEDGKYLDRKDGSGRKAKILTTMDLLELRKDFENSDTLSQRVAAVNKKCSQSFIIKTIHQKLNFKCYKNQKSPEYTEQQIELVKLQCR